MLWDCLQACACRGLFYVICCAQDGRHTNRELCISVLDTYMLQGRAAPSGGGWYPPLAPPPGGWYPPLRRLWAVGYTNLPPPHHPTRGGWPCGPGPATPPYHPTRGTGPGGLRPWNIYTCVSVANSVLSEFFFCCGVLRWQGEKGSSMQHALL